MRIRSLGIVIALAHPWLLFLDLLIATTTSPVIYSPNCFMKLLPIHVFPLKIILYYTIIYYPMSYQRVSIGRANRSILSRRTKTIHNHSPALLRHPHARTLWRRRTTRQCRHTWATVHER